MKNKNYENVNHNEGDLLAEWSGEGLPPVGVECEYYHAPRMTWVKFIPLLIVSKEDSPNGVFAMYGEWYHPIDCLWEADLIELEFGDVKFRKPELPQEKAKREREENGKALFELKVSLTSISCVHWDDQAENSKESWRQFAELVTLKDEHKE